MEDQYEHFSPMVYDFIQHYIEPQKREFFLTASVGFDASINAYISQHVEAANYISNVKYACELYAYTLEKTTLTTKVSNALELTKNLNVTCDDFKIALSIH